MRPIEAVFEDTCRALVDAQNERDRLRDALRLAETTRNAAQDIAKRETLRRRKVEEGLEKAHAEADALRKLAWRWCWVARDGWELAKVLAAGEGPIAVAPGPAFEKRTATGTLTVRAGDVLEGIEGRTTTRILVVYVSEETLLARHLWSRRGDVDTGRSSGEETWTLSCRDWRKVGDGEQLGSTEEGHDHG